MYVDLLNSNNYLSINISLIQKVGLNEAVYISELLNILKKAMKKNKLIEGNYVKVDRKFIASRTTLSPDKQRELDSKLIGLDLMAAHPNMKDVVSINSLGIVSLISLDENEVEKDAMDMFRAKTHSESNHLKGKAIAKRLKQSVITPNAYLRSLMNAWIDTIMENSSLTKDAIADFQGKVFGYSSDVNVVKEILSLAIQGRYAYGEAAIDAYEKAAKKNVGAVRVTTQRKATKDDVNTEVMF